MDKYNFFKGKDGQSYPDSASLQLANQEYSKKFYNLKAKDGSEHSDIEGLRTANQHYFNQIFAKIDKSEIFSA